MPIIKMSSRGLEGKTPVPSSGQVDYWDASIPGFGLRVGVSGRRSWIIVYRVKGSSRKRRMTIGTYPSLPLTNAREMASNALYEATQGNDPAAALKQEKKAETFKELADDYLERYAKRHKKTWKKDAGIIERDLKPEFRGMKAKEVRRSDVNRLLEKIIDRGAPIQANRTFEVLRKMFRWAISQDIVENSPCYGISKPSKETSRDRVLSADEIKTFWDGLENAKMDKLSALVFKMQMITAQRKGEVLGASRSEFDREEKIWTIPAERSKNGLAHRVPLSTLSLKTLAQIDEISGESELLFPSPRRDNQAIHGTSIDHALKNNGEHFKIKNFVPHDIRRTVASHMTGEKLGIPRLVVSKILNHAEKGVTAVYDRHSYDSKKRQALDAWAVRLREIVTSSDEITG